MSPGKRLLSLFGAVAILTMNLFVPVLATAVGVGGQAVAEASGTNYCTGLFTPGYWKNYLKNGAPLTSALPQTVDFASTTLEASLPGANYSAAEAVAVLQLQGKYVLRSLLSAELNVANSGLGNNTFPSISSTLTLNQLLDKAFNDYGGTAAAQTAGQEALNGEAQTIPAVPTSFDANDQTLVAYLGNGGGENASASSCKVGTPLPPPPVSDLSIVKHVDKTAVLAGDNLTYTIVVTNGGPDAATNVTVSDPLPADTTFKSLAAPAGWTCASGPAFPCSIASLANAATASFTLVVQVNPGTPGNTVITNTATVSPTDSTPNDNTSTVTSTVTPVSDLSIVKQVDKTAVLAGGNLTYTIAVQNTGDPVSNATVSDPLPANTTFVSLTPAAGWTCASGPQFPCSIPTLASGTTASFTLVVQVNPGTPGNTVITNTATVSPTDSTPNDNTSTVTSTVTPVSDLSIVKHVDQAQVVAGNNLTYTIVASNGGPDPATNVTVADPLPANTTQVSLTPPAGWTCASGATGAAFPCSISTLASGASGAFTLVVQVNPTTAAGTTITNTATVSPTDSTPNDNTSTVTSTVILPSCTTTTISGTERADNGNGTFTAITGYNIYLLDSTGTQILATTTLDSNGGFSFSGVQPGSYLVRDTIPNGYASDSNTLTVNGQMTTSSGTDVAVTIPSNGCNPATIVLTLKEAGSGCPVLGTITSTSNAANNHTALAIQIQAGPTGGTLTYLTVSGTNIDIYQLDSTAFSPPVSVPHTFTVNETQATVYIELINAGSGTYSISATNSAGCTGDPVGTIS